jgi:hypothetical protein
VAIHVPIAKDGSTLRLYQYVPLPINIADSLITFTPEHDIIAVSADERFFRTTTTASLARCTRIGTNHHCPDGNVLYSADKDSLETFGSEQQCIYSMYMHKRREIEEQCPMAFTDPTNTIVQVSNNRFTAFSPEEHLITVSCPHGRPEKARMEPPRMDFTLPDGCTADFSGIFKATALIQLTAQDDISTPVSFERFGENIRGVNAKWYEEQRRNNPALPKDIRQAALFQDRVHRDEAIESALWKATGTLSVGAISGLIALIKMIVKCIRRKRQQAQGQGNPAGRIPQEPPVLPPRPRQQEGEVYVNVPGHQNERYQ